MTVSYLRLAEMELGFSIRGMAEIIGVHPDVYGDWRSDESPLSASDGAWDRIRDALELRRIKEGR